jgi:hypothetical protein
LWFYGCPMPNRADFQKFCPDTPKVSQDTSFVLLYL